MSALFAVVLLAAAMDRSVAKDPASVKKVENHYYDRSPMDLVAAGTRVVAGRGYAVTPNPHEPLDVVSAWKADAKGAETRYRVRVSPISSARGQVRFFRETKDGKSSEDHDADWELMNAIDPSAAREIASDAPKLRPEKKPVAAKPSSQPAGPPNRRPLPSSPPPQAKPPAKTPAKPPAKPPAPTPAKTPSKPRR